MVVSNSYFFRPSREKKIMESLNSEEKIHHIHH